MTQTTTKQRCLIIADGPPPVPEHTRVEGGGLRTWGLAKGISQNADDVEVTIAYHHRFKKANFTSEHEGILLTNHSTIEDTLNLVSEYDTIIISYAMGELSVVVAENVRPDQQLILDCNVPAYVEVSARDSADVDSEYRMFNDDVERFRRVLRRGDLFLCASDAQKRYYQGVLSALGRINPVTYNQDLILVVPYGIYREQPKATHQPIQELIKPDKTSKKVLWFGGIYPWFDLRVLIDAIKQVNESTPTKLVIVGAKNPFNGHPDFIRKYDELVEYIEESGAKKLVAMQDWVDFNDRANWYLDSDAVVMINREGEENELSWRTRLVDYTWANVPILTNGGDPLGEILIANKAAVKLTQLDKATIAEQIESLLANPSQIKAIKAGMELVKERLYWDVVTSSLAEAIQSHRRAKDLTDYGQFLPMGAPPVGRRGKIKAVAFKAKQLPAYTKKHGTRNTYHVLRGVAKRRAQRYLPQDPNKHVPRVVAISHQLDISGAPFIIVDLVREMRELYPKQKIDFYTFNPAHEDQIKSLNESGIKPTVYMGRDAVPPLGKGDTVILNTIAHSQPLKEALYTNLENGLLKKMVWYIHEDNPEYLFTPTEINRIRNLIKANKLIMFTAAKRTKDHYDEFFGTKKVRIQNYRVITPQKYHLVRKPDDFKKLDFLLTGVAADCRKGQLTIFYAFLYFLRNYYEKNPKQYRDFTLTYIGLGPDLVSQQLRNHAPNLGKRFKMHPVMSKDKALEYTKKANITICYSLLECLPLFVYEGMITGHPIFRNDCSGIEEQLEDGKNGFYLETKDFWQVVDTIEKSLNTTTTSNEKLAAMSQRSYDIANEQESNSYKAMIDELL